MKRNKTLAYAPAIVSSILVFALVAGALRVDSAIKKQKREELDARFAVLEEALKTLQMEVDSQAPPTEPKKKSKVL